MLQSHVSDHFIEAGCDEAGRGCLAGPVFAAAVILPKKFTHPLLNDSKQLTKAQREHLRDEIRQRAIDWAVAQIDPATIDEINILNASFLAIETAVKKLNPKPGLLLIDGNRFKSDLDIPFQCIIKGDGKFFSIAAASILAKTFRDDYMKQIHKEYPLYDWNRNKGYPTPAHHEALSRYGITPHHRKTFRLERQLKMIF